MAKIEFLNSVGATVVINGEETDGVEVPKGSDVTWSVSLDGYVTQSGVVEDIQQDTVLYVNLKREGEDTPHLTVTPSELNFIADESTLEVVVDSSSAWSVRSHTEWLKCEPESGAGGSEETMSVTAEANPSTGSDSGSVEVVNDEGVAASISVTQDGDTGITLPYGYSGSISWGGTIRASVRIAPDVCTVDVEAVPAWRRSGNASTIAGVREIYIGALGDFTNDEFGVENHGYNAEAVTGELTVYTATGSSESLVPEGDKAGVRLTAYRQDGSVINVCECLAELEG